MKKYEKEYATTFPEEVKYLKSMGIRYTFVKKDDQGVVTWKYKKEPRLFEKLMNFYSNNEFNENYEGDYDYEEVK